MNHKNCTVFDNMIKLVKYPKIIETLSSLIYGVQIGHRLICLILRANFRKILNEGKQNNKYLRHITVLYCVLFVQSNDL